MSLTELMDSLTLGQQDFIASQFVEQRKPVCFTLDDNFRVLSIVGDQEHLGLTVAVGSDLREELPFMYGLDLAQAEKMELLELDDTRAVSLHLKPVNQPPMAAFVVLLDFSDQARQTREHQQLANELSVISYRQQQLMAELDEARRQAESASAMKSRFIYSMSHEFRTPISSILGYAGLLPDSGVGTEKSAQGTAKYAGAIQRAARHLLGLVENLLEQGRVESGKIDLMPEPLQLNDLFLDLEAMQAPAAAQKQLELTITGDSGGEQWVTLDPVRVGQILVNLVTNAIRYTEHGFVRVQWRHRQNRLQVDVIDSGPGIEPDQQRLIFDAFSQVDSAHGGRQGLGLGLAISQHLARLMDGDISLESKPGAGAKFTVDLAAPVCDVPAKSDSGEVELTTRGQAHVLVIEDDVELAELLTIVLEDCGYELTICSSLGEADAALTKRQPDVVLADMNLPDAERGEAIARMRQSAPTAPVLAMSAANDETTRGLARDAGALGYILKPFDFNELNRELERVIQNGV